MTLSALTKVSELIHRIETREAPIGIVGMGYVGLPLALLFCEEGFRCRRSWRQAAGSGRRRLHIVLRTTRKARGA